MQTFLPYASFALSAHVLDPRRLGKQRVECMQIIRAISPLSKFSAPSFRSHPAVTMWEGYEAALCLYTDRVIAEWCRRGYRNNMPSPRLASTSNDWMFPIEWAVGPVTMPDWLGLERFHAAHRAALLAKNSFWYTQFCWTEPPVVAYHWPGRLPRPGDSLVHEAHGVWLVIEKRGDRFHCLRDGERRDVSHADVRSGEWKRAVEG